MMHWLAISRKKKTHQEFPTSVEAVNHLIDVYDLKLHPILLRRLETSLVAKVPYEGVIEVVCCECQDDQHEGELPK
jgi:hypothetical protein